MRTLGTCWIGAALVLALGAAVAQPAALGDPSYTAWIFELPPNANPDQQLGSPDVFRSEVGPNFYAEDTLGGAHTIWGAPAGGTVYGTNTGLLWTTAASSANAPNGNTGVYIEADWQEDRFFKRPFSLWTAPRPRQNRGGTPRPKRLEPFFGCGLRSVGRGSLSSRLAGPAENRPSWAPAAGYPWSPARCDRSRERSDAADPSGPCRRVA